MRTREQRNYHIVAIGASAGGLEAIHEFFDHTENNNTLAYIIIQHLSPDYKSLLVELVAKHTNMKVYEAGNTMQVKPGCVYIIPNNKLMTIKHGKLILDEKIKDKMPNTAVDTFLFSLAKDQQECAIAVILSGTGTDGTKGIEAIKENKGYVLVQEPESAKFDGMPNSAISSQLVDLVLTPSEMPGAISDFISGENQKYFTAENEVLADADDKLMDKIFTLIYNNNGHDFNFYKSPTIKRRIERRMLQTGYKKLPEYVSFLEKNDKEIKTLGQEFLIGVTRFFRDKEAFDTLTTEVLPHIIDEKTDGDFIKVWVCACSTGEEAYSIAIVIDQYLKSKNRKLDVKIFATDIDETGLSFAQNNSYPQNAVKDIDPDTLENYFIKQDNQFLVIPRIRKQIVFAKHNAFKNPPFIKNDLVTCRNMLIYVNQVLQQKLLATFHFSLNEGGFLFLGPSESAGFLKDAITEINPKWKIYKKTAPANFLTQEIYRNAQTESGGKLKGYLPKENVPSKSVNSIEVDFNNVLINELGYIGLYINEDFEIKETIGDFKTVLSLPEGKLNLNLLKMVPQVLSIALNTAVRKSQKQNKVIRIDKILFENNNRKSFLNIIIKPLKDNSLSFILIGESQNTSNKDNIGNAALPASAAENDFIQELEGELKDTKTLLQRTVEEMDATNEELQSANEELLSANEELQSSNEELQSLNEELHTLNTEHQAKIKELIDLNDDLNNYFRSNDIGQIFIDSNFKIRKFNPAAIRLINLIETDIGRPINHISTNIQYDNLITDIKFVMFGDEIIEKEILLSNGSQSIMRVLPYIRQDKKIDGVVVTFIDVSATSELNNIIKGTFNSSKSAIIAFKSQKNTNSQIIDFKIISANHAAKDFLKSGKDDLKGLSLLQDAPQIAANSFFEKYVNVVLTDTTYQSEFQDNAEQWYQVVAVKMMDGFVATFTNITDKKVADRKLKKNYNELILARENLRNLNIELEQKVKDRTKELSESEERFSLVSKATNDTIWDWDLANNTMWRSGNFTKMFGYEKNEETLTLDFWLGCIHEEEREKVRKSVYNAINNNTKQWSAEYKFLKADGEYAYVLDRAQILQDDYGTPYRMLGSVVDITKLNEVEKKFNDSESRFRKIFESNMIGMVFSNIKGNLYETNDAFINMIGYSRNELASKNITWKTLTPEEFLAVSNKAVEEIKESGICRPFEKEYIRKDGSRVSVLVGSASLSNEDIDVVTYVIDISEKKKAEKKQKDLQKLIKKQQDEFQSIFMNAPAHIIIKRGEELRYEFLNKEVRGFMGFGNPIGKTIKEVKSDWENTDRSSIEKEVYKTGKRFSGKAYPLFKTDTVTGDTITNWFDFIIEPVFNDDGKIDGVASFAFNVTDLIKSQKATNQLMQKKDEFMSIASHELKTPITSMKAIMQIVQRLTKNNESISNIHQFITKANTQVNKLTSLVDDLLDVTKIHAGKLELNPLNFKADEIITEAIENIKINNTSHQIIVENNADVTLFADKNRLEQVVNNFLSNSIKYSPESNKVVVKTKTIDNHFKVSVQDFGIGIPGDKADFVFDRFFRVQESSQKFSGLGLGLYICAEIIERHHGKIGVFSKEGEGSTFWFMIPLEPQLTINKTKLFNNS